MSGSKSGLKLIPVHSCWYEAKNRKTDGLLGVRAKVYQKEMLGPVTLGLHQLLIAKQSEKENEYLNTSIRAESHCIFDTRATRILCKEIEAYYPVI